MKNAEKLRDRIAQAFASSMGEPEVAREIAFHMTDWDHNVDDLIRLYEQAESLSDEEIRKIVLQLLAHVPNHGAAAKKLVGMGPIEDVFGVGVLAEDEL
jgi:hypothetical protein